MTLASNAYAPFRFSTRRLSAREGLTSYRDMLDRSVGSFDVEPIGERFAFEATSFTLPGLGIAHIESSALGVRRAHEAATDGTRDLVLAVVHRGDAAICQRGREVTLRGSGAFLSSSQDALVMERTAAQLTNYSLRRKDLAPAIADLDRALLTAMPANSEAMTLLSGYTRLAFRDGTHLSAEVCRLAVRHIHDLIALAIRAAGEAAEVARRRGQRAARRADLYARTCRLIALRFGEAGLAPGEIAQQLGVSLRLLQEVFAERGETVMTRLWSERVHHAAVLLSAPEAA